MEARHCIQDTQTWQHLYTRGKEVEREREWEMVIRACQDSQGWLSCACLGLSSSCLLFLWSYRQSPWLVQTVPICTPHLSMFWTLQEACLLYANTSNQEQLTHRICTNLFSFRALNIPGTVSFLGKHISWEQVSPLYANKSWIQSN